MQTRATRRLAEKLASYAKKHSWNASARRYKIIGPDGKPSRGLAKQIACGYEPKKTETRRRIGLPEKVHAQKPVTPNQLFRLPIQDMPSEILRLALEHRTEMTA